MGFATEFCTVQCTLPVPAFTLIRDAPDNDMAGYPNNLKVEYRYQTSGEAENKTGTGNPVGFLAQNLNVS
jgi:hypothetical protein